MNNIRSNAPQHFLSQIRELCKYPYELNIFTSNLLNIFKEVNVVCFSEYTNSCSSEDDWSLLDALARNPATNVILYQSLILLLLREAYIFVARNRDGRIIRLIDRRTRHNHHLKYSVSDLKLCFGLVYGNILDDLNRLILVNSCTIREHNRLLEGVLTHIFFSTSYEEETALIGTGLHRLDDRTLILCDQAWGQLITTDSQNNLVADKITNGRRTIVFGGMDFWCTSGELPKRGRRLRTLRAIGSTLANILEERCSGDRDTLMLMHCYFSTLAISTLFKNFPLLLLDTEPSAQPQNNLLLSLMPQKNPLLQLPIPYNQQQDELPYLFLNTPTAPSWSQQSEAKNQAFSGLIASSNILIDYNQSPQCLLRQTRPVLLLNLKGFSGLDIDETTHKKIIRLNKQHVSLLLAEIFPYLDYAKKFRAPLDLRNGLTADFLSDIQPLLGMAHALKYDHLDFALMLAENHEQAINRLLLHSRANEVRITLKAMIRKTLRLPLPEDVPQSFMAQIQQHHSQDIDLFEKTGMILKPKQGQVYLNAGTFLQRSCLDEKFPGYNPTLLVGDLALLPEYRGSLKTRSFTTKQQRFQHLQFE